MAIICIAVHHLYQKHLMVIGVVNYVVLNLANFDLDLLLFYTPMYTSVCVQSFECCMSIYLYQNPSIFLYFSFVTEDNNYLFVFLREKKRTHIYTFRRYLIKTTVLNKSDILCMFLFINKFALTYPYWSIFINQPYFPEFRR